MSITASTNISGKTQNAGDFFSDSIVITSSVVGELAQEIISEIFHEYPG